MEEIKIRDKVIDDFIHERKNTGQPMVNIELVSLQFRKIAELIIVSALCVHREEYEKYHKRIEKEWDANKIKKTLDNIHPDFYPVPFNRAVDLITGKHKNVIPQDGYLTKDECISLIGKCGDILHAFNPHNDKKVYGKVEAFKNSFDKKLERIRRLLFMHEIKLFGTNKQLWVYMFGTPDGKVRVEERVPV